MSTITSKEAIEQRIVTLMRSRDKRFLDLLYTEYGGIVYTICLGMLKSKEEAEDVLQETLVKVWKNVSKFDEKRAKVLTWVVQIAKNTALDHLKSKASNQAKLTETMSDKPLKASYGISTQNEDHIGLREMINKELDKKDQRILNMLYFEGYSQREVAEELEMPLGSVKTRIRYTVNHLRTYLKQS